jgi:UDP-3-O-[3-hydroxymyristoyl] N-acetylglucosamine deacetylase
MPQFPSILLAGPGLHDGLPARLRLGLRAESGGSPGAGPSLRFPGLGPLPPAALGRLSRQARRSTRLGDGEAAIGTPEHLLAALLFFPDLPVEVECDAAELPGLDGSALPFREALARLASGQAFPPPSTPPSSSPFLPAWREYPSDLDFTYHWGYGHMRVRPAAGFSVLWRLDRPPLQQAFRLADACTAFREILPARTFAFHGEWLQALQAGLMAGATQDSGLLLAASEGEHRELLARHPDWRGGPYPLLNQPAWRMPDEPVKHKILDLLGDLALLGLALPRLEIEILNGGHAANHHLMGRLLASGSVPG